MNRARAMAFAVMVAACAAAPSLAAQERLPVGAPGGDTLRLTLEEAHRLALTRNPAFLADATERDIALGDLREAHVYSFNPEAELDYAVLAAERRLAVATELQELNERLLEAVRTQVREGEISVMEEGALGEHQGVIRAHRPGRARARGEAVAAGFAAYMALPMEPLDLVAAVERVTAAPGRAAGGNE